MSKDKYYNYVSPHKYRGYRYITFDDHSVAVVNHYQTMSVHDHGGFQNATYRDGSYAAVPNNDLHSIVLTHHTISRLSLKDATGKPDQYSIKITYYFYQLIQLFFL